MIFKHVDLRLMRRKKLKTDELFVNDKENRFGVLMKLNTETFTLILIR